MRQVPSPLPRSLEGPGRSQSHRNEGGRQVPRPLGLPGHQAEEGGSLAKWATSPSFSSSFPVLGGGV